MTNEPLRKIAAATLVAVIFVVWFLWALPWKFIAIAVSIVILAIALEALGEQLIRKRGLRSRPLIKAAGGGINPGKNVWGLMYIFSPQPTASLYPPGAMP